MRIAFTGKMRSGKDEAVSHLIHNFGGYKLSFAGALYAMQHEIYSIAGLPWDEATKDRFLLQFLGTQWGRQTIDPNIWVNILENRIKKFPTSEYVNLFISDARFPNEVEMLRKNGFQIVKILRPEEKRIEFGAKNLNHESETALDGFNDYDHTIFNDFNLATYHSMVRAYANTLD